MSTGTDSLRAVLSLFARKGDQEVVSSTDLAYVAAIIVVGGSSLLVEGVGAFALVSALVGQKSFDMSIGALLGLPAVSFLAYVPSVASIFGLVLLQRLISPALLYASNRLGETVAFRLRQRLLSLATTLPAIHAGAIPSGEMAGVLNEEVSRCGRAITAVVIAAQLLLGVLMTGAATAARDPGVSFCAIVASAPALAFYLFLAGRTSADTAHAVTARIDAQASSTEGLRSLAGLQAVGAGQTLLEKLLSKAGAMRQWETRIYFNTMRLTYVTLIVPGAAATGALAYGLHTHPGAPLAEVVAGLAPLATVGLRLALALSLAVANVYGITVMATSLLPTLGLERRLEQLRERANDARGLTDTEKNSDPQRVLLKKLGFQLPNGEWLFRGVSAIVERQRPLVIRGPSGVGKSTLASMVAGLNEPTEGTVSYETADGDRLAAHPHFINYLSQDPAVVAGTIRDNLALGLVKIPNEDELQSALSQACLWEELTPKGGLDARVFEGGRNLSGGQVRRLGIARLLCRRRRGIWIFDEPTAALDSENARLVEEVVRNVAKDAVTLVITHDLSFSTHAEEESVLDLIAAKDDLLAREPHGLGTSVQN